MRTGGSPILGAPPFYEGMYIFLRGTSPFWGHMGHLQWNFDPSGSTLRRDDLFQGFKATAFVAHRNPWIGRLHRIFTPKLEASPHQKPCVIKPYWSLKLDVSIWEMTIHWWVAHENGNHSHMKMETTAIHDIRKDQMGQCFSLVPKRCFPRNLLVISGHIWSYLVNVTNFFQWNPSFRGSDPDVW